MEAPGALVCYKQCLQTFENQCSSSLNMQDTLFFANKCKSITFQ